MSASVPDAAPEETKSCVVCGTEIKRDITKKCPVCSSDPDGTTCSNCKKRLPSDASFCNECKTYQDFRQHFTIGATLLSLVIAGIAVVSGVRSAGTYLSERDSHTKFKVTSSDGLRIYLKVWNTGRQPSMLVGYHLRFAGNPPIHDVTLQLSSENVVAASNVIPAGQPVKIGLAMTGSESLQIISTAKNAPDTKEKLSMLIGSQPVVLDVDVEESDDPSEGFCRCNKPRLFHTRRDTFPADRIRTFLVSRSEVKLAEPQPTQP